jgi:L-2,4-diaminobutyrate decarboxylase
LFDADFLTSTDDSKRAYRLLIAQATEIVSQSLPRQPYCGKSPSSLSELVDSDFLRAKPGSLEEIGQTLRRIVANSVSIGHPHTIAHLHCPPLLAALAAEVVISVLNQSMDSFDQAPIATIVEQKMIRWLCSEIGLPAMADGTFTTGGSQSNYMGLLLARDAFLQKHWSWSAQKAGLPPEARRLRILCSEVAHFTVEKSASQLGLGMDSVIRVDVDDHFCMRPSSLQSALQSLQGQGLLPMAVVATAGTTDFGSIDPMQEVDTLARQAAAWLHVDAAYGGALVASGQHRGKLTRLEAADSLTIDFHKLFWQPIPCSAFLVRDAKSFDSIRLHTDYLNPELHEDEGIPNLVTTSLLTSRRFDALKLWISFQALGREKLGAMIDRSMELAKQAAEMIRSTPELELICPPQLSTVVFRYVPGKGSDADRINAQIRQTLFDRGLAVIGHTRVKGRQCLKFTCMNPSATKADLEQLVELIRAQGQAILDEK